MRLPPFSALRDPAGAADETLDPRFRALEEFSGGVYGELQRLNNSVAQLAALPQLPPGSPPQDEPSEFPPPDYPGSDVQPGDNDLDGLEWDEAQQEWVPFDIRGTFVLKAGDTMTGPLLIDPAVSGAIEASALLELRSTTKGFLIPRMDQAASNTLESIAARGLSWFNTALNAFVVFGQGRSSYMVRNLYNQRANKSVSNSASELTLTGGTHIGSLTLPANWWLVFKSVRFKIWGAFTTTGTPTVRLRFYMGTVLLVDTGALTLPASVTDKQWIMEGEIVCQAIGASGTLETNCFVIMDTTRYPFVQTAGVTFDSTISNAMDLTAQFSVMSVSNIITVMQWSVDSVP